MACWCARQLGAPRARCLQRKLPFTAHAFRAFSLDGYYTLNYGKRVPRGAPSWIHTDSCSLTDRPSDSSSKQAKPAQKESDINDSG
jgi:hypothetical protein